MCDSHNHNNNSKHNILFCKLQVPNWSSVIYKWLLCAFHNQFLMFTFFHSFHSLSFFLFLALCSHLANINYLERMMMMIKEIYEQCDIYFFLITLTTKSLGLRNRESFLISFLSLPLPSHLTSCSHHRLLKDLNLCTIHLPCKNEIWRHIRKRGKNYWN
jgi:hypothetical protein